MIFSSVEAMNNAAHVLEIIDATLSKLKRIENANVIDKDGQDIKLKNADIQFDNVSFAYDEKPYWKMSAFKFHKGVQPRLSGRRAAARLQSAIWLQDFMM